jgi:hypothetical protein
MKASEQAAAFLQDIPGQDIPGQGIPGQGIPAQGMAAQGMAAQGMAAQDMAADDDHAPIGSAPHFRKRGLFGSLSQALIGFRQPRQLFTASAILEMVGHGSAFLRARLPTVGVRASSAVSFESWGKARGDAGK